MPGCQAEVGRHVRLESHLYLRHHYLWFHLQVGDAGYISDGLTDFCGLISQDSQIWAIQPHHHGRTGTGQHFFDPFAQVRQHIPVKPRITVDDGLDFATVLS